MDPFRDVARQWIKNIGILILVAGFFSAWNMVEVRAESEAELKELIQQAVAGDPDAQFNLGYLYYTGQGVDRDLEEAFKWYSRAAEQGDKLAQYFLGDRYYYGRTVPVDFPEAFKWYSRSAEQGYDLAQSRLADMYEISY